MNISVLSGCQIAPTDFYTFEDNVFTTTYNYIVVSSVNTNCTFNLLNNSMINCSNGNTIVAGKNCNVTCGSSCNVVVGEQSTVNTYHNTTVTATGDNVTVIRKDFNNDNVFQIVTLQKGQTIRFKGENIYGYKVIEKAPQVKLTIDGKEVTLSEDSIKSIMSALK